MSERTAKQKIEAINPKWEYYMDSSERYVVSPETVLALVTAELESFAAAVKAVAQEVDRNMPEIYLADIDRLLADKLKELGGKK